MLHFTPTTRRGLVRRLALLCVSPLFVSSGSQAQSPPPKDFLVAVPGNLFARLGKKGPEGVFLETMDAILNVMGKKPRYVIMPTGDALAEMSSGAISAATVVVPSPRLAETLWLSDPLITESNIVVALKDKGFALKSLDDLRGKRIGARTGYRYPLLENSKSGSALLRYSTDGEMLRALLFGQVDVILCSAIADIFALRSEGIMKRLVVLDKAVGAVPLVAAFAKSSMSKAELDTFNSALAAFKKSSQWTESLERNGQADLFRSWPSITQ